MKGLGEPKRTVALVGNPNVGKSTLFNLLTGLHQHTGNWPGKTVGLAKGFFDWKGQRWEMIDLPGTYALSGGSEDEKIAAQFILSGRADCTVVVCDATCLERSLILALQILELTVPVVVCVNLVDEASRKGIYIDTRRLAQELGAPVVMTSAGKKQGVDDLLMQIDKSVSMPVSKTRPATECISEAERIAKACVQTGESTRHDKQEKWDKLLVSRRWGIPVMLFLLFVIIWITVWGANYPSLLLQELFMLGYDGLKGLFFFAPEWVTGFFIDGMYATATRVLAVMLPPMAIFFPLFTILEDVGYFPRMALLLDGGMRKCGGCGKQALTLCMGLGCNAVGVTGCRIIDSPRERLMAILTNAMVPCNGRFPTLILLGSLFFSGVGGALTVALCVVLGVLMAMLCTGCLSKTVCRHAQSAFLMEMPPFRRPRVGQILIRSMLDRTLHICLRALKVAAPAGGLLWLLANTPALNMLTAFFDPVGRVLGMRGEILLAFFFSLPANELFVPVVMMSLTGAQSLQSAQVAGTQLILSAGWGWPTALCTMVFTLFHWPCVTTLMSVYRETGSKKQTAAALCLPTAVGVVLCLILNFALKYII